MYLDEIVAHKKIEIATAKTQCPIASLEKRFPSRELLSLRERLQDSSASGIIAEFKRKSPSKGWIHRDANPREITSLYQQGGCSGISVLVDQVFFGGSVDDVVETRTSVNVPILFKEFIIDKWQIAQARHAGADVILLIAAVLTPNEVSEFAACAHSYGLETLLELHGEDELDHINDSIDLIGINNRNLKTFEVSLEHSIKLCHRIPDSFVKISESGISSIGTIHTLRAEGFQGFLMGENFMKQSNPGEALTDFIAQL